MKILSPLYKGLALTILLGLTSFPVNSQSQPSSFPSLGLKVDAQYTVVAADRDKPSQQAGVHVGDRVVAVDDQELAGMSKDDFFNRLKGAPGTSVSLTLERGKKRFTVKLIRGGPPQLKPDAQARKMVVISARTPQTPVLYNYVLQGLAYLPAHLKDRFIQFGVTVNLTPTRQVLTGDEGRTCYLAATRQVVMCERPDSATTSTTMSPRSAYTTLHELGHAYDHMVGRVSRSPQYLAAYNGDVAHLTGPDKKSLAYFLLPGGRGSKECFASLFACKYFGGKDKKADVMRAKFPRALAFVKALSD